MARFCKACGRSLDDHKVDGTQPRAGKPGRGKVLFPRSRRYLCRVRPIARDFRKGRIVPTPETRDEAGLPDVMSRTEANDARFVHEDRLKIGGDLHDA